jgi:hypothetical protein
MIGLQRVRQSVAGREITKSRDFRSGSTTCVSSLLVNEFPHIVRHISKMALLATERRVRARAQELFCMCAIIFHWLHVCSEVRSTPPYIHRTPSPHAIEGQMHNNDPNPVYPIR